jgi:hypothetical protein
MEAARAEEAVVVTEQRCDLTDLLVDQCGCDKHRGGEVIERPETVGQPFPANYSGFCPACEGPIQLGQMIARLADEFGYVHAGRCPR